MATKKNMIVDRKIMATLAETNPDAMRAIIAAVK
jgi:ribosomal protein L20